MKKEYNKLVRDNIIEIIRNDNKPCNYRVLESDEYLFELSKKLKEEVNEYLEDYSIDELADVQEVINAIVKEKGYTKEKFDEIREKKEKKNGGFDKKLFLIDVTERD